MSTTTNYIVPPVAASAAIMPVFRDLIVKSAVQKGKPIPSISFWEGIKEGAKAAPTIGTLVASQLMIQGCIEKGLFGEGEPNLGSTLVSSAMVGIISAPVLAIFNGQTMNWTWKESLRRFSAKQALAITAQETAFVAGISFADRLSQILRKQFGDSKVVDYGAAFVAGATGSLVGHPANTALTRWQSGLTMSLHHSMWGAARKARAIGCFSVLYKFGKETLS